jgi:glycosyltransferase involved in cell wall biosynthesis
VDAKQNLIISKRTAQAELLRQPEISDSSRVTESDNKLLRWWIVEDALRDRKGHWLEYLQTFQRGLMAEGDEVRFFASKECAPDVASLFDAEPVLPKSIWARMGDAAPKWRRLLRIPAHGLATYRAVSKLLADCPAPPAGCTLPAGRAMPDLIFVPTALVHHLVGWIPLIKRKLRKLPCRVLLFFPNAPVDLREDGTAYLPPDPTAKLFRICIRSLAKEVASGKVILGAETRMMVKALSEVTGVPFTYLPHPVELSTEHSPDTGDSVGRLGDPSPQTPVSVDRQGDLSTASPPVPATAENPIVFGCYGAARHEKGSDVLQAAIRLVLERDPEIPARFAFQWLGNFGDSEGKIVTLDPWLKAHPKVDVIEDFFAEGGYAGRLAATDVMVLPYRAAYRLRVSRVVIEAMNLGMPVVATRNTTLHEQAKEFGVARDCSDGSAEDLAASILDVVRDFAQLRDAAKAKVLTSRAHFSVKGFCDRLSYKNTAQTLARS